MSSNKAYVAGLGEANKVLLKFLSLYKKAKDNEVGVLQVLINGEIQQEIPVYKAITPKVESQSWFDKLINWFTGAVSF